MTLYATSEVLIDWDEVCKVAEKELIDEFNSAFENLRVAYKLVNSYDLDLIDYFIYYCDSVYSSIDSSDFDTFIIDELNKKMNAIIADFTEKTGISLSLEANYESLRADDHENGYMFILDWNDVMQFTPKAHKLFNSGIRFGIESWSISDY